MAKLQKQVQESLEKHGLEYKVIECDPDLADTASFCKEYGFKPEQSVNTILIASRKIEPQVYSVCAGLATTKLDVNNRIRKLMGVKRVSFADGEATQKVTGMMIHGVTIPGIDEDLPVYVDAGVMTLSEIIIGGGSKSAKIILNPQELTKLPNVEVVDGLAKPVTQD